MVGELKLRNSWYVQYHWDIRRNVHCCSNGHRIPRLIVSPADQKHGSPGVLWIHVGAYIPGIMEMVYMSRAIDLVSKYKAVVVSPGYCLAFETY